MNIYTGIDDKEIGLMSLLDDLIVLHNGERYTINGYIIKLQNNWNELKKWLESKGTSTKEENDALCYFYTYKKMLELEEK